MDKFTDDGDINQQWLAEEIARKEGKEKSVDIGQIKEILKITLDILAQDFECSDIVSLLEKHK